MITIDDICASPKLGRDKSLPLAKGKILIPTCFGGVESTPARPKRPRAAAPLQERKNDND